MSAVIECGMTTIGLLGTPLPDDRRIALEGAGLRIVTPERADVRLYVHARPPTRPPTKPWLWCSPKPIGPSEAATAVLAGAYDVVAVGADLVSIIQRRVAELSVHVVGGQPPPGFVARSAAAKRVIADLERVARTSMAV